MTVRSLFEAEPHISALRQAMDTLNKTDPGYINMVMDLDGGSHGLYAGIKSPASKLIQSKSGLEKAKSTYDQAASQLSDNAKIFIMTCLYGMEENKANADDFLLHALKTADTETQIEVLNARVFNPENIEHPDFDTEQAHLLFCACTAEAQDYTRDNMSAMAFEKLAYYAYGVQVNRKNPDMARIDTGDVSIPFHLIEDDSVREYCQGNEDQIHDKLNDLSDPISEEGLKTIEATYKRHNMAFDRDKVIKERIAGFKQEIIGETPDEHFEKFKIYQRALKVTLSVDAYDLENNNEHN